MRRHIQHSRQCLTIIWSKHLAVHQKYSTMRRIFNSVSSRCLEMLSNTVFCVWYDSFFYHGWAMLELLQYEVKKQLIKKWIKLHFHTRYKFYILQQETHVSSNLAQQVGFDAGQPAFSHARNCFPFSLDQSSLSKNCFLFVVLGDRQVPLPSILN